MKLSKERLDELKRLYEAKYHQSFSDADVSEIADNLIRLFRLLEKYDREDQIKNEEPKPKRQAV